MKFLARLMGLVLLLAFLPSLARAVESGSVSFQKEIAPILMNKCQGCHGPEKAKGAFRLDTFERLNRAGESKAAPLVAGKAQASHLYQLIATADDDDRMPKKGDPLSASEVTLIQRWIDQGAKFDGPDATAELATMVKEPEQPAPPAVYPRPVAITALAFSPDGKELAAGGYHEITLWNPTDGKLIGRIKGLGERVYGLAYSPDGKQLAVADGTPGVFGEVRLCDPAAQTAGKRLERISDVMLAVRFSPDGKQIAAGGADNAVHLYDAATGKREMVIEQHADWVSEICFSPDGTKLATASRDKSSRVFDCKTGATVSAFLAHEEFVSGVAFGDDGKSIYSAGRDRKLRMWQTADAKASPKTIKFDAEPFKLLARGGMLFSTCADGMVRQYSQQNLDLVREFPAMGDWVYAIAVDVKNSRLAAGCFNGQVKVWDIEKGTPIATFTAAPGLHE
jgi:WD40 repeat protein